MARSRGWALGWAVLLAACQGPQDETVSTSQPCEHATHTKTQTATQTTTPTTTQTSTETKTTTLTTTETTTQTQTATVTQTPIDVSTIDKFVEPLPLPSLGGGTINTVLGSRPLTISMCEFKARPLSVGGVKPETWVWGYIVGKKCPTTTQDTFTGPIIVNQRHVPTRIRYINQLGFTSTSHLLAYVNSTDQTLHWADPLNNGVNKCHAASMVMMPGMRMPPSAECAPNYAGPIPAVPHLHGGEVPSWVDGGPTQWFTSDGSHHGNTYYSAPGAAGNETIFTYPNTQEAGPLWFHDHTLGATRLNVYAGLAGAYVLTDPRQKLPPNLPGPESIIPMVIQDRMFDSNGQLYFPAGPGAATNPEHPYWSPEFFGNVILVNGKAWPYATVEAKRQRLLFLGGSNARTYELALLNQTTNAAGPPMFVIGTDGGYLDKPAKIDFASGDKLTLMPGERYDVIIDFGGLPANTTLILRNSANAPYPSGDPVDENTSQIMQFRIAAASSVDTSWDPAAPNAKLRFHDKIERLADPSRGVLAVPADKTRQLTLNEVAMDDPVTIGDVTYPGGPLDILVNNTMWSGESTRTYGDFVPINQGGIVTAFSELPREGDTEVWEVVNLTMDAHPIHLHLVQFQIINRQDFNATQYAVDYSAAFPGGVYKPGFGPPLDYRAARNPLSGGKDGGNINVDPYLLGTVQLPRSEEAGWKDTIRAMPGQVTRIVVRWAPTDLPARLPAHVSIYPFNPGSGPGYVWHCHIIDHEDNEMMRPTMVLSNHWFNAWRTFRKGIDY